MKRYALIVIMLLPLMLSGCADADGNNIVTDDNGRLTEAVTPDETENNGLADYEYYDKNKINIVDWTTEIPVITVPAKIIVDGVTYRYVYNDAGDRIAKYAGDDYRIDYEYEQPSSGSKSVLISEMSNQYSVEYTYEDVDGIYYLCGLKYNGKDYTYIKDDSGFITAIKDFDGNVVAEYTYVCKDLSTEVITTNYTDENIGDINSMLFENSYYDRETGFCCDYVYTNYVNGRSYQIKAFY